jgi:hypothetical protein
MGISSDLHQLEADLEAFAEKLEGEVKTEFAAIVAKVKELVEKL